MEAFALVTTDKSQQETRGDKSQLEVTPDLVKKEKTSVGKKFFFKKSLFQCSNRKTEAKNVATEEYSKTEDNTNRIL